MRTDDLLTELEQLLARAKPVPLTDQVRVKPDDINDLIRQLREALAADRRN